MFTYQKNKKRALVVGAGKGGNAAVRQLLKNESLILNQLLLLTMIRKNNVFNFMELQSKERRRIFRALLPKRKLTILS
ncbi:hypothetical protein BCV53_01480 [Parageobacillus thermoglucosidasius]|uniref:Uncharacterized protein n=2 Tax=Parageobacillus thermoglucosidasius TaxID=1426 RepID=A0AAN0YLU4_PARTM|nr:hypothetical protein AOT13_01475 [Parageobacillus thermoglucosidasius]ANZ28899.1 hypothetical protein BCV53_01480 [Parageobacillus thermoglucosidasius]APM79638.1 hypothetical protein BCV54_01490 [Parageobacillus thermoglucosidasius]RDE26765.1 hypothetical protein DV712_07900 [Parageobacillus thermoglucosidasius]